MKNIIYFLILFISLSCQSQNENFIGYSSDKKELINKFLDKNDKKLKLKLNLPVDKAYAKHLIFLSKINKPSQLSDNYFLKDKVVYDNFINMKILEKIEVRSYENQGNKSNSIKFTYAKSYLNYLKKIGKTNEVISNYYKVLKSQGDISPGSTKIILNGHSKLNFKNKDIRLIVCLHFLLINQDLP